MNAQNLDGMILRLLKREGWDTETDDPADSGGRTKWGVTQSTLNRVRTAHRHLPANVSGLTLSDAVFIYSIEYLAAPRIDEIVEQNDLIGELVFDFAVLAGPATSVRLLQRALNVLNYEQRRWPDQKVDGLVGPATLGALRLARTAGYAKDVAYSVAVLQTNYLIELAERRTKDERFIVGWQRNRAIGLLGKLMNGLDSDRGEVP